MIAEDDGLIKAIVAMKNGHIRSCSSKVVRLLDLLGDAEKDPIRKEEEVSKLIRGATTASKDTGKATDDALSASSSSLTPATSSSTRGRSESKPSVPTHTSKASLTRATSLGSSLTKDLSPLKVEASQPAESIVFSQGKAQIKKDPSPMGSSTTAASASGGAGTQLPARRFSGGRELRRPLSLGSEDGEIALEQPARRRLSGSQLPNLSFLDEEDSGVEKPPSYLSLSSKASQPSYKSVEGPPSYGTIPSSKPTPSSGGGGGVKIPEGLIPVSPTTQDADANSFVAPCGGCGGLLPIADGEWWWW